MTGSVLKAAIRGEGRRVSDDPECRDNLLERRVRFALTPDQEIKADRPFQPLGLRKEKRPRKEKRKITAETWNRIRRQMMEDNCEIEAKLVKDLDINDKKAVEKSDIGGKDGPKPEKDETPTPTVSFKEPDPVALFMKRWGKIIKMAIKREGARYESKMNPNPKESAGKTEE